MQSRKDLINEAIQKFLTERLDLKLQKLEKDADKPGASRADYEPKSSELRAQFAIGPWIVDAARRAPQLRVVTHLIKAIHPDAKGTQLFCHPASMTPIPAVSSHSIRDFVPDVTGNAAALDVHAFLSIEVEGKSILQLIEENDPDLRELLADSDSDAQALMNEFLKVKCAPDERESHTLAKQVFWLVGEDPSNNDHFHLLAPLYPSSLAQHMFSQIQEHRFGKAAKEARHARKAKSFSSLPVHDYRRLAVQKLGGSNAQNVSKLNAARNGQNYLLDSLPPQWKVGHSRPPFYQDSVFEKSFPSRPSARTILNRLGTFLKSDPPKNKETRDRRDKWLEELLAELLGFVGEVSALDGGWSADPRCRLSDAERLWLDPTRADPDSASFDQSFADARIYAPWQKDVANTFGRWVNRRLGDFVPMGDAEYLFWREMFAEMIDVGQVPVLTGDK